MTLPINKRKLVSKPSDNNSYPISIDELIENARRNEQLLRRLQAFELKLLSCQNWYEFLILILEGLPAQFDLDAVTLKICDPNSELKSSMLTSLDLNQGMLLNQIEFQTQVRIIQPGPIEPNPPWQSALGLPLMRNDVYLGQLLLYSAQTERFIEGMATDYMQHLAAVTAACLVMVKQTEERAHLALTDPLTGAQNRRGFERTFLREWALGLRQYHHFAIILFDLDFFKAINDVQGHAAGDRVLKELIISLKKTLRPTDHIGRLGGEEFAIILPSSQAERLDDVAQRVLTAIREMKVYNDRQERILITASGSYMSVIPRANLQVELSEIIDHLDKYLYKAKNNGRNQFIKVE